MRLGKVYQIVSLILFAMLFRCSKDSAPLLGPGLFLSIDKPADTWYHLRDFLNQHHVKLTFYIEEYQKLHDSSINILKQMQSDGHEIAHHTSTHPHSTHYVMKYGMNQYLKHEIFAMTDSMRQDGFNPVTFAYPFGDCSAELDNNLLQHFNSLRKTIGTYLNKHIADMDQLYFRYGSLKLFFGTGIDVRHHHSLNEVFEALEKAKSSRQTLSLYCHFLSTTGQLEETNSHIMEDDLKQIILKAKELGLRFYTASEISRIR